MKVEIVNVIGTAEVGFKVDFKKALALYPKEASYNHDLYHGLWFRPNGKGSPLVTVYHTGKMICVGCNSEKEVRELLEEVAEKMLACRSCRN